MNALFGKVFRLNFLHWHFFSCPQTERFSPLVKQHIHAIKSGATSLSGQLEQCSFLWLVNNIGNYQALVQIRSVGNKTAGNFSHANRCGVE